MVNTVFAAAMVAVVATGPHGHVGAYYIGQPCEITSDTHMWDLDSLKVSNYLPYRAYV